MFTCVEEWKQNVVLVVREMEPTKLRLLAHSGPHTAQTSRPSLHHCHYRMHRFHLQDIHLFIL
jgi:hypothetical protein